MRSGLGETRVSTNETSVDNPPTLGFTLPAAGPSTVPDVTLGGQTHPLLGTSVAYTAVL